MTEPILELKNVSTVVNKGTASETTILKDLSLTINPGDLGPTGPANRPSLTSSVAI